VLLLLVLIVVAIAYHVRHERLLRRIVDLEEEMRRQRSALDLIAARLRETGPPIPAAPPKPVPPPAPRPDTPSAARP